MLNLRAYPRLEVGVCITFIVFKTFDVLLVSVSSFIFNTHDVNSTFLDVYLLCVLGGGKWHCGTFMKTGCPPLSEDDPTHPCVVVVLS